MRGGTVHHKQNPASEVGFVSRASFCALQSDVDCCPRYTCRVAARMSLVGCPYSPGGELLTLVPGRGRAVCSVSLLSIAYFTVSRRVMKRSVRCAVSGVSLS